MKPAGRLAFLDSLRGLAASYVVVYHTALIPTPALRVPGWAASFVLSGGSGVTLFFVASAFSLCRAARPDEDRGTALVAYALRRFFRIGPLFYVVLAISVLRDGRLFSVWHGPTEIVANAAFVFNLWPGHETGIVWASWTIGVEMLFYAAFPYLVTRVINVPRAAVLVIVTLMVAAAWPAMLRQTHLSPADIVSQEQFGVARHLPIFAAGLLAWCVFERFSKGPFPPPAIGLLLLAAATYLYSALLSGTLWPALFGDAYYWQAVVYVAVVLGLAIHPTRLLVNNVTRHVGRVSYSLYLLHPLIVYSLIPFYRWLEARAWPATFSFAACALVTLAAAIVLATVSYLAVEEPGIRLGRRVERALAQHLEGRASVVRTTQLRPPPMP